MGVEYLKQELARLEPLDSWLELAGSVYGGSSLVLRHGGVLSISFVSKSPAVMRYVLSLSARTLSKWQSGQATLARAGRMLSFTIELSPSQVSQLFPGASPLEPSILEKRLRGKRAASAFTKGFFLISGYAAPDGTHLEFSCSLPIGHRLVDRSLSALHVSHGWERRRSAEVTYVKSRADIMSLLACWGASSSLISLEELQLERDIDNQINRTVNAELGNLQRETLAVETLRQAYERIDRSQLSQRTRQIVQIRLKYPSLPLSQLVNKIPGRLSKSTIHYHIQKAIRDAH